MDVTWEPVFQWAVRIAAWGALLFLLWRGVRDRRARRYRRGRGRDPYGAATVECPRCGGLTFRTATTCHHCQPPDH